jgi:hypothetical protein
MRAAARRQVERFDVDQPERAAAKRLFPQRQARRLVCVGEPDRHRPILPDEAVRVGFRGRNLRRRQLARHVDRRRLGAEMKAHRAHAKQFVDRRRQHVLAGVLLHVIEAPRPIYRAADRLSVVQGPWSLVRPWSWVQDVRDRPVFLVDHIDNAKVAQPPGVERLAAGCGIERGAVEDHAEAFRRAVHAHHGGVERLEVRIGVVEASGHLRADWPLTTGT